MPTAPASWFSGHEGAGLLLGVSLFYVARAFANGGSAMTGTEAISNGVSVFRKPQAANARTTLVIMSTILGAMFLGVSVLAALAHATAVRVGHADSGVRDRQAGLRLRAPPGPSFTGACRRPPLSS